jgi:hypothetical protein
MLVWRALSGNQCALLPLQLGYGCGLRRHQTAAAGQQQVAVAARAAAVKPAAAAKSSVEMALTPVTALTPVAAPAVAPWAGSQLSLVHLQHEGASLLLSCPCACKLAQPASH